MKDKVKGWKASALRLEPQCRGYQGLSRTGERMSAAIGDRSACCLLVKALEARERGRRGRCVVDLL